MLRCSKCRNRQPHHHRYRKSSHGRTSSHPPQPFVSLTSKDAPHIAMVTAEPTVRPSHTRPCPSARASQNQCCWSFSLTGGCAITVPAVEHAVKPGAAPVPPEPAGSASSQLDPHAEQSASQEDPSQYCLVGPQRLEARRRQVTRCVYGGCARV